VLAVPLSGASYHSPSRNTCVRMRSLASSERRLIISTVIHRQRPLLLQTSTSAEWRGLGRAGEYLSKPRYRPTLHRESPFRIHTSANTARTVLAVRLHPVIARNWGTGNQVAIRA